MKLKFRAELKDIIIFIIFCFVLLYLVAIGVSNLNTFAEESVFSGLNPITAFTRFPYETFVIYILCLLLLMLSCSSLFFDIEEGFGITTKKKTKNDGYSKFLSEKDMKKERGIIKVHLTDDTYESGGIPIINDGKDAWVDAKGEPHALIMGASGSGKTQAFMFPLIKILARAGESMIVTDPKGELYENCGALLKEKGYKLILVNFRDPKEGAAWNPFSYPYRVYKEGNADKANELLQDLASNILIDPNNKAEPFWEQTASNFFTGLSLGLFDDATEDEININSINMMAEVGEDRIGSSNYIKEYFKSKGELSPAYIAASSCINAPNETRGGIMSTFRTKTRIFSSQKGLSEMLSYSDFDIRDIGKEKTAVFLKVHDEKTTYHALATIFVKQVYEALIAVAQTCPNLKLPYRTNFILDEFANMPALKDVETMITASRSRNIRFTFVIQNFSQLNKVYGKDVAETIKGNCGNFVYIMSTELAALEEVSKLLGDAKPSKPKKDEPAQPIRPLFSVSDLQALKEGEVIINRFRSMPFKSKLVYDYKIDWGKKYELTGYTERQVRELKVFDVKAFVNKMKEEEAANNPMGGVPMGMPGMMGNPFMGGMMGNPFMGGMPGMFGAQSNPQGPVPGGRGTAGIAPTSLDDYVKRLDEKIAELEREEAEENARKAAEAQKSNRIEEKLDRIEDKIEDRIEDKMETEFQEAHEEKQENIFENKLDNSFEERIEDHLDAIEDKVNEIKEGVQNVVADDAETKAEDFEHVIADNYVPNLEIPVARKVEEETYTPMSFPSFDEDDDEELFKTIDVSNVIEEVPTTVKEVQDIRPTHRETYVENGIPHTTYVVDNKTYSEPTYDNNIEKANVKVNADDIKVENKENKDNNFFDDFFGGEDE